MVHHKANVPMGPDGFLWSISVWGGEELQLRFGPGVGMTWDMWVYVIEGLKGFMRTFEYVDLDFDVIDIRMMVFGHGSIGFAVKG